MHRIYHILHFFDLQYKNTFAKFRSNANNNSNKQIKLKPKVWTKNPNPKSRKNRKHHVVTIATSLATTRRPRNPP